MKNMKKSLIKFPEVVRISALYFLLFLVILEINVLISSFISFPLHWTGVIATVALVASFFTSLQVRRHEKRCKEAMWKWTEFQFRELDKRLGVLENKTGVKNESGENSDNGSNSQADAEFYTYLRQGLYFHAWGDMPLPKVGEAGDD
jgi:hypothetical protein